MELDAKEGQGLQGENENEWSKPWNFEFSSTKSNQSQRENLLSKTQTVPTEKHYQHLTRKTSKSDKMKTICSQEHCKTKVHIDLDCFYAQVEMIHNPALRDIPLGRYIVDLLLVVVAQNRFDDYYGLITSKLYLNSLF